MPTPDIHSFCAAIGEDIEILLQRYELGMLEYHETMVEVNKLLVQLKVGVGAAFVRGILDGKPPVGRKA